MYSILNIVMKNARASSRSSYGGTNNDQQGAGGAGGALATGAGLGFLSNNNPATCTDDSFGCKLSHVTHNLGMFVRIILLVVAVVGFLYFVWTFIKAQRSMKKK